jgi:hypothetical protein
MDYHICRIWPFCHSLEAFMNEAKAPSPKSASELLDLYYLDMRSGLLEAAAALDRIERGRGYAEIASSPRLARLREALVLMADNQGNRTERFLNLFSED